MKETYSLKNPVSRTFLSVRWGCEDEWNERERRVKEDKMGADDNTRPQRTASSSQYQIGCDCGL